MAGPWGNAPANPVEATGQGPPHGSGSRRPGKFVGAPKRLVGGIKAGHLIAPGAIKGLLGDSQSSSMWVEAACHHVGNQPIGQLGGKVSRRARAS